MVQQKRPAVGLAVIVRKNGKALIGFRHGSHAAETWSFPGGHLEWEESFELCGRREVKEEAGIEIANVQFAAITNDPMPEAGKHYVTNFLTVDWKSGDPVVREPDRCRKWRWVDWTSLPRPLFSPVEKLLKQSHTPFPGA